MRKPKFTHPLKYYAETYNVSIATVKRWSAAGLNLEDPEAIDWELSGQKNAPADFTYDPTNKPVKEDDELIKVIEFHLPIFENATELIQSGEPFEGTTLEQTREGNPRLMRFLAMRLWKHTIRAMQGEKLENFQNLDSEF